MKAIEALGARRLLTSFTASSVADLVSDINAANAAGGPDTITLAPATTFTLTARDNENYGFSGLPAIEPGGGGFELRPLRQPISEADFRFLHIRRTGRAVGAPARVTILCLPPTGDPITIPAVISYQAFVDRLFGGTVISEGHSCLVVAAPSPWSSCSSSSGSSRS